YAAVTRRRPDDPRPAWYPQETLSVQEALRAYTVGAAYASGEEAIKGTLAPGRLADFIVVDRDLLAEAAADPQVLLETRVLATVVGGTPVHSAGPLAGLDSDA
ncbi:MAG: amidohydrolase family protein, partial [Armatimonadota bacterium]|nr:amidohydrolase family protein [Armatimonadota bacterium]